MIRNRMEMRENFGVNCSVYSFLYFVSNLIRNINLFDNCSVDLALKCFSYYNQKFVYLRGKMS